MYLAEITTLLTTALQETFDNDYPVPEFRNLNISPEYPMKREQYPAIWVDFEPAGTLHSGGIGQILWTPPIDGLSSPYKIWMFQGHASYTAVALSSLERDRLFDELVKTLAFGGLDPAHSVYRKTIESNDLIATNIDFDNINQSNRSATSGTPWGTDDILYEITADVQCIGEFKSDPATAEFVILESVDFIPTIDNDIRPV
jgi:hypothetical protein